MKVAHQCAWVVCILWFLLTATLRLCHQAWPESLAWADGLFAVFIAVSTTCSLALRLPVQNVVSVSVLILLFTGGFELLGTQTGIPYGPYFHTEQAGFRVFGLVTWLAPVLWLAVFLNSRGVARLILRPWRKFRYYGFWVIGLSALLMVLMDAALQPFASHVQRYWLWTAPPTTTAAWQHVPWTNYFGRFAVSLFIMAFATPWLINKQPSRQPADFQPLFAWCLLQFLFAAGNASLHLWPAVVAGLVTSLVVSFFAWRGASW